MSQTKNDTPQTGQTGQSGKKKLRPWFEVARDKDRKWHWMLWSANGRRVATNDVPLERRKDAVKAIKAFKAQVNEATEVVVANKEDNDDETDRRSDVGSGQSSVDDTPGTGHPATY